MVKHRSWGAPLRSLKDVGIRLSICAQEASNVMCATWNLDRNPNQPLRPGWREWLNFQKWWDWLKNHSTIQIGMMGIFLFNATIAMLRMLSPLILGVMVSGIINHQPFALLAFEMCALVFVMRYAPSLLEYRREIFIVNRFRNPLLDVLVTRCVVLTSTEGSLGQPKLQRGADYLTDLVETILRDTLFAFSGILILIGLAWTLLVMVPVVIMRVFCELVVTFLMDAELRGSYQKQQDREFRLYATVAKIFDNNHIAWGHRERRLAVFKRTRSLVQTKRAEFEHVIRDGVSCVFFVITVLIVSWYALHGYIGAGEATATVLFVEGAADPIRFVVYTLQSQIMAKGQAIKAVGDMMNVDFGINQNLNGTK